MSSARPVQVARSRNLLPWVALLLGGCAAGPDYHRPALSASPAALQAFSEDGAWRAAAPAAVQDHAPWWQPYGDAGLDALLQQVNDANQTLQAAAAQYRQADALARATRATLWPQLDLGAEAERARTHTAAGTQVGDTRAVTAQASWEPDLWGRLRRSLEAAGATARASQADLSAVRLEVQAAAVDDYIELRLDDSLHDLFVRTIDAYQRSLQIAEAQLRTGVATMADVSLARNTLAAARAQAVDVDLARSQTEHALAVLAGKVPADFRLAAAPLQLQPQPAPAALPSTLLERRPDIAAAEQRVIAANAGIGIARAAWFPDLDLTASRGESVVGSFAAAPAAVWALGAALAGTLFDGGARRAQNAAARAAFDVAAADYRQTVLAGFQDVEDNLAALRELAQERNYAEQALQAARESQDVLLRQYQSGTANYLAVIQAQALALGSERSALQLRARELAAGVALIKALGGAATE